MPDTPPPHPEISPPIFFTGILRSPYDPASEYRNRMIIIESPAHLKGQEIYLGEKFEGTDNLDPLVANHPQRDTLLAGSTPVEGIIDPFPPVIVLGKPLIYYQVLQIDPKM